MLSQRMARHRLSLAWMATFYSLSVEGGFATFRHQRTCFSSSKPSFTSRSSVSISDAFDGGSIELVSVTQQQGDDSYTVHLKLKPDVFSELEQTAHCQHFLFRSTVHSPNTKVNYVIDNAGQASYPSAWPGSTVFYGDFDDLDGWRRKLDTNYVNGQLRWSHLGNCYFGYFPPFSYIQHLTLISQCQRHTIVQSLGQTIDGREIDCVIVGSGRLQAWIIHRQHPGESMAEYFAQGLLTRLLGLDSNGITDGLVQRLLETFTFYIVPNMNPDGSVRGHLRTNAVGANLNREWADSPNYPAPTLERSPEVYYVFQKMIETGVDCFVDVHGDEELPFNFMAGAAETKHWGPRLQALHGALAASYARANPDFQTKVGYGVPPPGSGDRLPNLATHAIANRFNCLAVTLEMPFKDCLSHPDPERGWNPSRSRLLGASLLDALSYVSPYLRAEGDFWSKLPDDDAYVRTSPRYK